MIRWFLAFALLISVSSASGQAQVQGIDHVPIAVRDLDRAAADFSALGFVLKPGREHPSGLRNVHAKFVNGTEIELITAREPTDALSARYVEWLKTGDGPVAVGLYVSGTLPANMDGIFFDRRQRSPTDRPEHFAHPNGALALSAVWLAGSSEEHAMMEWPAGKLVSGPACAPFGTSSRVVQLVDGEIVLLPRLVQRMADRPVVALSVTVRNLANVRKLLAGNGLSFQTADGCARRSVWVDTHGVWLEFRES